MTSTNKNLNVADIPTKKKLKWKRWAFLVFLIAMIPIQYLNHTGFCYKEGRYLTEREVLDRFLLAKWKNENLTEEQKIKKLKSMSNYPNNAWMSGIIDSDLDKTFGNYRYSISSYYHKTENNNEYPYEMSLITVNSCGEDAYLEYSESLTSKTYKNIMTGHKRFPKGRNK